MSIYLDEFETLYGISDNIEELRNKILELALQGNLIEQQNDESSEEFYKEVMENKDKLFKKKKFRERKFNNINKIDIPFKIPNNWKWVRMADVVAFNLGKTPKRSNDEYWYDGKYPWIKISDYNNYDKIDSCEEKITELAHKEKFRERISPKGTLIMSFKLTIGKVGILDFDSYHNEAIISIYPFYDVDNTFRDFLFNFLPLLSILGKTKNAIKGNTLNSKSLSNLLIPIPPLKEQKRIVEKIEKLMKEVDKLETKLEEKEDISQDISESIVEAIKNSQDAEELKQNLIFTIDNFDVIFKTSESIDEMKNIVLQLAIEGKLVPQKEEDDSASELIEKLKTSRKLMIEKNIIKKTRYKRKEIKNKEIKFEIPDSWKWLRLIDIGSIVSGGTPKTNVSKYWNGDISWVTPADINKNYIFIEKGRRNITQIGLKNSSAQLIPEGSILFSSRAPIGKTAIAKNKISTNQGFKSIVPYIKDTNKYIYYFLKRDADRINNEASGTTFNEISGTEMANLLIPFPPIEEQKRIVKKVDSIMGIIDKLEKELIKKEDLVEKLGSI